MVSNIIRTMKNRVLVHGERNCGKTKTEQSHISIQRQIEDAMLAGKRLFVSRLSQYDAPMEADPDTIAEDLTRRYDFSATEASMIASEIVSRSKKASAVLQQKIKEKLEGSDKGGTEKVQPVVNGEVKE